MSPNINDCFPSKYLKAHELQNKEPVVTIAAVEFEAMGRAREVLPVLYFRGKQKGLKLNKTMASAISQIAGSGETEHWIGVAVQLYATSTDFGGQGYAVVRIKAPATRAPQTSPKIGPKPAPLPVAARTGTHDEDLDDPIPF